MYMEFNTYFYDGANQKIGSLIGLVPLVVGSEVFISEKLYFVDQIQLHVTDKYLKDLGFRVFLSAFEPDDY